MIPRANDVRSRVDPGDVPPVKAARRLHLTLAEFTAKLPELYERGFPHPDPTTGMFDLEQIDQWRRDRHKSPSTAPGLTRDKRPRDAQQVFSEGLAKRG